MTAERRPRNGNSSSKEARSARLVRRFSRWLAASSQVEQARASLPEISEQQQIFVRRARLAREVGNRTFEPVESLPGDAGKTHALDLYRQAAYWALLALAPSDDRPTAAELWARTAEVRQLVPMSATQLTELERIFLVDKGFVAFAEWDESAAEAAAETARALVGHLLDIHESPKRNLRRALIRRWIGILVPSVTLTTISVLMLRPLLTPVNLARGVPWRTSSTLVVCEPDKGVCGGFPTRILFHTLEEWSPWFELDFGKPTSFSAMSIRNREEFEERAIPLVVEVSNDGKAYRRVARKAKRFSTWEPEFEPRTARFVRLRVDGRSMLHLIEVRVHP